MKVLITGGAGFIGSKLAEKLIEQEHEVYSYDLKESNVCESIIGDITDVEAVYDAVKQVDYVYHLAAIADLNVARLHPELALKVNVDGTYIVAKCCSDLNVPLSFASTICVYGNTPNHPSTEESICVPTDIYGVTKVVGETIIKGLHEKNGLTYNILRFGTTYGPGLREALAVHIFIRQALENKPLTIHGSGLQTRCMIYVDDLVEGCFKVLDRQITNETLNLATDEELSVLQVAYAILKEIGRPEDMIKYVDDRPGQIMRENISIRKAEKLLNWSPKTKFKEGLTKTLEWIQNTY